MKLSDHRDTSSNNLSVLSIQNDFYNESMSSLSIFNLPRIKVETKLDFIKFSFLLSIIPEENIRKSITKSRITEPFWSELRNIREFQDTFEFFSDKELLNVYKYITFFPVVKEYELELIAKAFIHLVENSEITPKTSLAEIGRIILKYMKKITRKNGNPEAFRKLQNLNLLYYFYHESEERKNERLSESRVIDIKYAEKIEITSSKIK